MLLCLWNVTTVCGMLNCLWNIAIVLRICGVSVADFAVVESANVQYTEIISGITIIMYHKLKM